MRGLFTWSSIETRVEVLAVRFLLENPYLTVPRTWIISCVRFTIVYTVEWKVSILLEHLRNGIGLNHNGTNAKPCQINLNGKLADTKGQA